MLWTVLASATAALLAAPLAAAAGDSKYAGKNVFSPSGRLLQSEYARAALDASSLCVGVRCADGVLLGVAKRRAADERLLVAFPRDHHLRRRRRLAHGASDVVGDGDGNDDGDGRAAPLCFGADDNADASTDRRITRVAAHAALLSAGRPADARALHERARLECRVAKFEMGAPIAPARLAERLGAFMHATALGWRARTFANALLIAAVSTRPPARRDDDARGGGGGGVELFTVEPGAPPTRRRACAFGAGAAAARRRLRANAGAWGERSCSEVSALVRSPQTSASGRSLPPG